MTGTDQSETRPSDVMLLAEAIAGLAQQIGNQAEAIDRLIDYLIESDVDDGGAAPLGTYMDGSAR